MKARNVTFSIIILLIFFLLFILKRWHEPQAKEMFNRHPAHLIYTRHAQCRMQCRHIDSVEINEIIEKGVINLNKSNKYDRPCPTFALQGFTHNGEDIRVIVAQCNTETRIITCYNLKQDFECHCPGDENKGH